MQVGHRGNKTSEDLQMLSISCHCFIVMICWQLTVDRWQRHCSQRLVHRIWNQTFQILLTNVIQLIEGGVIVFLSIWLKRRVKKNENFTVSPVGPDRKQMRRFWPIFFYGIWLYDTQHILSHCEGSQNAFLMPLTPLLYHYLTVLWQSSSSSKEELGILVVGWKWLFWCKIHFRTHRIIF